MMKRNVNNEIILSVVIPTCNRNNTILRAIYSVLNQNIDELEIIVVNDTENPISHDMINIVKYNPVLFTSNPGTHGAASARNYGVSIAKGKYITFLDDDDMYLPSRLNNMLTYIEKESDKLSFVSSGRFFEINDFQKVMLDDSQKYGVIKLSDVLDCNGIDIGFMMRRELFNELGGFDEKLSSLEDWDFILRSLMISDGYKIERLDYAVNCDVDRPRVSLSQEQSRNNLADKYLFKLGKKWYFENKFKGLCELGEFSISYAIKYLLYSRSFNDFKSLVYYTLKKIKEF